MHPIASRFSPEARQAVVEAFSDAEQVSPSHYGLVARFRGQIVCPIGLAMIVDGKDADNTISDKYYVPSPWRIGETLCDDLYTIKEISSEAIGFMDGPLRKCYSRENVMEAFGA